MIVVGKQHAVLILPDFFHQKTHKIPKMIYQIVVALAVAAAANAKLYSSDATLQKFMWETFKTEHHRDYATAEEEAQRFGFFLENLKLADQRNEVEKKAGGSARHGITKFADLSKTEFAGRYLTADASKKTPIAQRENAVSSLKAPSATAGLVDWTGIYTTPVKDQVE